MVSTDTASTCSGWGNPDAQFAHSRTTSTSSQATGVYESGDGNMAHLPYVQSPVYHGSQQQMMSPQGCMQPNLHSMVAMIAGPPPILQESWNENGANDEIPVLE